MLSPFHPNNGTAIASKQLTIPKARELAAFLQRPNLPFIRFIRCERRDSSDVEAVVFEVDVELGQRKRYEIKEVEPVGVVFSCDDKIAPQVLALSEDFPITPHQSIRKHAPPRWLCLDEEPYSEQKLRWSPLSFIEQIREWLRLTAIGKLHDDQQPLENLLGATIGTIILPNDFQKRFCASDPAGVRLLLVNGSMENPILRVNADIAASRGRPKVIPILFVAEPVEHGVITEQPMDLYALHEFCRNAKLDLLDALGARLRNWIETNKSEDLNNDHLALIVIFPKKRHASSTPEDVEIWVFLPAQNIREIATALGIRVVMKGFNGVVLNYGDKRNVLDISLVKKIEIWPLLPVFELSSKKAAIFNGFNAPCEKRIAAVGMGALGSQVFNSLLRTGFGSNWTLIDKDILMPHNCARHALFGRCVGFNKADSLAFFANNTIEGSVISSISADIFNPGDKEKALSNALEISDVILDFSASVSAARYLGSNVSSTARRASFFLNPSGTDSVGLVEDSKRKISLISLEMEYYRLLANHPSLSGHLANVGGRIRYARSCGEISSRINQNLVALHAAIGSQFLRTSLEQSTASIAIFRANAEDFTVQRYLFKPEQFKMSTISGWAVHISQGVLAKIHNLRKKRMPNETGGVLVGYFDRSHRAVYLVDLLPAPQDSIERPVLFIRGVRGLNKEIKRIKEATMGHLDYIGEWHSHPPGCLPELSTTDRRELKMLAEEMGAANLPGLMLIAADRNRQKIFIRETNFYYT